MNDYLICKISGKIIKKNKSKLVLLIIGNLSHWRNYDLQRYPLYLILSKNIDDILVFPLKVNDFEMWFH